MERERVRQGSCRWRLASASSMHSQKIDEITALLQNAPQANPGDYTSLEEFAGDLLRVLAEKNGLQAQDEELANMVTHLVRRQQWYEKAVLCDFHILNGAGDVNMDLLRAWAAQALVFRNTGHIPSYNALLAIGYTWLEAYEHAQKERGGRPQYKIFLSEGIPCPESRPSPPPPRLISFFADRDVPHTKEELQIYLQQLEELVGKGEANIMQMYFCYLAECHEPDMLPYHMNTIGHTYRENTEEQWREMAARHISQHNFFLAEFEAFRAEMSKKTLHALRKAEKMDIPLGKLSMVTEGRDTVVRKKKERIAKDFLGKWKN